MRFVDILATPVYDTYVESQAQRWSLTALEENNFRFHNYPMARYATDVMFQPCFRPTGRIEKVKRYYSSKHKMHGYKVEVSVLPNGMAIGCSSHQPASVSDLAMFQDMQSWHKKWLMKRRNERDMHDNGPSADKFENSWAVLVDKGYQGAQEFCRVICPARKPPHGALTLAEITTNSAISSDHTIVENFFGRLCFSWKVLGSKWTWAEGSHDTIFILCLGLTNYHILHNALHERDGAMYRRMKNRWYQIGKSQLEKRRQTQAKYREKRRRYMDIQLQHVAGEGTGKPIIG